MKLFYSKKGIEMDIYRYGDMRTSSYGHRTDELAVPG